MKMKPQEFALKILDCVVDENKSINSPILTGEKDLTITKQDLIDRVSKNEHGEDYLEVMEREASILAKQGLFHGYINDKDGNIYFDIPDWDAFISSVDAFYKVCYAPDSDDEEVHEP